jgi:hypothetical protein
MSVELTVIPFTGEAVDLASAGIDDLARLLADVKEYQSRLSEARSLLSREVLRRQDQAAKWTTPAGGYVLKSASPAPGEEFDALALREDLLGLVDEGALSIQAVDAAVETIVTYKARKSGVNALRKLGGVVAQIVDRHARPVEKARYVSVVRDA